MWETCPNAYGNSPDSFGRAADWYLASMFTGKSGFGIYSGYSPAMSFIRSNTPHRSTDGSWNNKVF
jgi:hypothetical protein